MSGSRTSSRLRGKSSTNDETQMHSQLPASGLASSQMEDDDDELYNPPSPESQPAVEPKKVKDRRKRQKLHLKENGELDLSRITMRDLIQNATNIGKPTKAALEREQLRRKKRLEKSDKNGGQEGGSSTAPSPSKNNDASINTMANIISSLNNNPLPVENNPNEEEEEVIGTIDGEDEEEEEEKEEEESNTSKTPNKTAPITETNDQQNDGEVNTFAPRVRFVDGKIVIDEESLIVSTEGVTNRDNYNVVYESGNYVTSNSYTNYAPSEKWNATETAQFYRALRQYGTDFSLIEKLFPNRSRRQIRNKFKKEERENSKKIDDALTGRLPIDMEEYKALTAISKKVPEPKKNSNNNNNAADEDSVLQSIVDTKSKGTPTKTNGEKGKTQRKKKGESNTETSETSSGKKKRARTRNVKSNQDDNEECLGAVDENGSEEVNLQSENQQEEELLGEVEGEEILGEIGDLDSSNIRESIEDYGNIPNNFEDQEEDWN